MRILGINRNEPKSTNPFILSKKSSSNIKPPSSNLTATSNSFGLLSGNIENSLDGNKDKDISIEDNNAETYSNKRFSNEKKVNFKHNRKKQERKNDQIVTTIVGDFMVKDMCGWELTDNNEKFVVKHFSGLTTEDIMTFLKPPLKRKPDRFIIHVGTNDLRSNQDPEIIARNNVEAAINSKTDTKVLISSIVSRPDNLNGKGLQVNIFLQKFCMENDFVSVIHGNIKPQQHWNYGGIHLNTLGSKILADNFILAPNALT